MRGEKQLMTYTALAFIFLIAMTIITPYLTQLPTTTPPGSNNTLEEGTKGDLKYVVVKIYPKIYPLVAKDDIWLGDYPITSGVDKIDLKSFVSGSIINYTINSLYVRIVSSYEGVFCSGGGFSCDIYINGNPVFVVSQELPYKNYELERELTLDENYQGDSILIEVYLEAWARGLSGYAYAQLEEVYIIVTIYYTEG